MKHYGENLKGILQSLDRRREVVVAREEDRTAGLGQGIVKRVRVKCESAWAWVCDNLPNPFGIGKGTANQEEEGDDWEVAWGHGARKNGRSYQPRDYSSSYGAPLDSSRRPRYCSGGGGGGGGQHPYLPPQRRVAADIYPPRQDPDNWRDPRGTQQHHGRNHYKNQHQGRGPRAARGGGGGGRKPY